MQELISTRRTRPENGDGGGGGQAATKNKAGDDGRRPSSDGERVEWIWGFLNNTYYFRCFGLRNQPEALLRLGRCARFTQPTRGATLSWSMMIRPVRSCPRPLATRPAAGTNDQYRDNLIR